MNNYIEKEVCNKAVEKYNLPKPISVQSMNGKTTILDKKVVESSFDGEEAFYIFFTDNTVIVLVSSFGWEGELDTPEIKTEIDLDYLFDIIRYKYPSYYNDPHEHVIYKEVKTVIDEKEKREGERKDKITYEQLKRKFESD